MIDIYIYIYIYIYRILLIYKLYNKIYVKSTNLQKHINIIKLHITYNETFIHKYCKSQFLIYFILDYIDFYIELQPHDYIVGSNYLSMYFQELVYGFFY